MKKIGLLFLSLLLWTSCVKDNPQEPENKETQQTQETQEGGEEHTTPEELKKPVKITVTGKGYGNDKEIHFLYDDKGRIQKMQKWIKLTDPVVFEYVIDYAYSEKYPKVTMTQYQKLSPSNSITDIIQNGMIRGKKEIYYADDHVQGDYNLQFQFEEGRFIERGNNHSSYVLFGKNIAFSDSGGYPIQLNGHPMSKYDDKNHPFKNINVFLNPSFLDFDDNTGNWDWSAQETFLLLPIYPYEKAMKYTNNLIEYEYSKLNWNNEQIYKTEKRRIVYDTDDFPTEITLSDGVQYVIEYNKKADVQTPELPKKGIKKPSRITEVCSDGTLWNEYLFHYDDKGRLNKIVWKYVTKSYTYTYDISYQEDSNRIAKVDYFGTI